jgi:hypothetical protein
MSGRQAGWQALSLSSTLAAASCAAAHADHSACAFKQRFCTPQLARHAPCQGHSRFHCLEHLCTVCRQAGWPREVSGHPPRVWYRLVVQLHKGVVAHSRGAKGVALDVDHVFCSSTRTHGQTHTASQSSQGGSC